MKNLVAISLILACLGTGNLHATGTVEGWYAGMRGGISHSSSAIFNITPVNSSTTIAGDVTYEIAGGLAVQAGYRCGFCRIELEALVNYNPVKNLEIDGILIKRKTKHIFRGTTLRGDTIIGAGLINGFIDLNSDPSVGDVSPYIGLGIGYARMRSELRFFENGKKIGSVLRVNSHRMVGQGIVGLGYALDSYTTLGVDYRYLTGSKQENSTDNYKLQMVSVLFNVAFDGANSV